MKRQNFYFRFAIGASVFLHFFLFLGLSPFVNLIKFFTQQSAPSVRQLHEIDTISMDLVKKWKTVGIKNGKKEMFSMPMTAPKPERKKLALADVGVGQQSFAPPPRQARAPRNSRAQNENQLDLNSTGPISQPESNALSYYEKSKMVGEAIRSAGLGQADSALFNAAGFDVKLDPPEGVEENQLNDEEKVYYAFQKRAYTTYISSLVSEYHNMLVRRPRIKEALIKEKHSLTARVIFDGTGNIKSVNIVESTLNDDILELFENGLKNMKSLPNPPKNLVKDGSFQLYYRLLINA